MGLRRPEPYYLQHFLGVGKCVPRGLPTLASRILTISLGSLRSLFSLGRPDPLSYRNAMLYKRKLPPGSADFMFYDTFCGPVSWPQGDVPRQVTEMSCCTKEICHAAPRTFCFTTLSAGRAAGHRGSVVQTARSLSMDSYGGGQQFN